MFLFLGMVLVLLAGCQKEAAEKAGSTEEQPLSQEEADVADSLDDLDDLEQMDQELQTDLGFEDLEGLELE